MRQRIIPSSTFVPGTKKKAETEPQIDDLKFTIHKCSKRTRPSDVRRVVIFPIFAEFGSEVIVPLYCIPYLMNNRYQGKYTIVMGWYGRKYLYEHLVDEFWELDESHQWLREYSRALHHDSKNLNKAQKKASEFGTIIPQGDINNICSYPKVNYCERNFGKVTCGAIVNKEADRQICSRCGQIYPKIGIFYDIKETKKEAIWIPTPSAEKLAIAKEFCKPNSVGITARARKCYGRNLDETFYERLIILLENMGYNPIWLGEKATSLPCPVDRIVDFSRHDQAKDLETTLAIVSQLKFTIQFWTASTRLSGLVGTPFILFESPDQIWSEYATGGKVYFPTGKGQEGYRINLCTKGEKKIVVAHYLKVLEDQTTALKDAQKAILEVEKNDFSTYVGQVENKDNVIAGIRRNNERIGF